MSLVMCRRSQSTKCCAVCGCLGLWDGSARSVSLEIFGLLRHCGGRNSGAACSSVSGKLPIKRVVAAAGDTSAGTAGR